MRTTAEENYQIGVWIAQKLNQCQGAVTFIIPTGGFSALDIEGGVFWSPQANQAFIDAFKSNYHITTNRKLIVSPHHINSAEFCQQVIQLQQELMH